MDYRMILTYDFSDNPTRSSFEELAEELGFVKAEDQSTYALPFVIQKKSNDVIEPIVKWSTDKKTITAKDFIQLFYLIKDNNDKRKIASKYLKYNPKTKGLI